MTEELAEKDREIEKLKTEKKEMIEELEKSIDIIQHEQNFKELHEKYPNVYEHEYYTIIHLPEKWQSFKQKHGG